MLSARGRSFLDGTNARIPTLPALDGIRALAIAAVVTYHGEIFWAPGGLLGVEVFFVLSGYLITSLLWSELLDTSRVAIGTFLMRRARRLFPALFVMLALASTAFVLWFPDEVGRIRGDVAAAATYTSNWYLVGTDHSYFTTFARPSPFAHLWSLAIEEQFYLLWPPILFLLWKVARRRAKRVAAAITAGAAGSVAALFLLYAGGDPSRVYYGTDTRAAGLLIGAALAVVWRPFAKPAQDRPRVPRWALDGATLTSLAFLVFAFMRFDDLSSFTYRPGLLLVALATATLVGAAVHPDARVAKVLGSSPLRWLGKRSYGIYIWYFPVFVVTRPGVDYDITLGTAFAMRTAATLTLAELSYRFIEEPVRNGALGRLSARIWQSLRTPGGVRQRTALRLVGTTAIASLLLASLTANILNAAPPLAEAADQSSLVGVLDQDDSTDPMVFALPTPHAPVDVRPPVAIGDSVMTSARSALRNRFGRILIDAAVARQVKDGIAALERLKSEGRIGRVVIIHLGNNGRWLSAQVDRIMRILSGVELVVFVNVRVPRRWESSNNQTLAAGVQRHAGRAVLLNWKKLWRTCPAKTFGKDGTHLSAIGARCYSRLIANASVL
ncbi:MAG: acyltransferase family protein [Actinomycetota bacterium]